MAKLLGVRGSNPARLFGDGGLKVIDPRRTAAGSDADAAVGRLTDPSPEVASIIHQYVFNESLAGRWQYVTRIWMTQTNAASAYTCLKSGSTATPSAALSWAQATGVLVDGASEVDLNYDAALDYADASELCIGSSASSVPAGTPASPSIFFISSAAGVGALALSYSSGDVIGAIGGASAVISPLPGSPQPRRVNRLDVDPATGYARMRIDSNSSLSTYPPFALSVPDISLLPSLQNWRLTYFAGAEMDWEGFRDNTQSAISALGAL